MISQFLVNGLIAGSIYALVAVGFSLIYSTNRFVYFAHGHVVMCGAYFLYAFFDLLNLNFYLSAILAIICSAFLGLSLYLLVFLPLKKRNTSPFILLIASVASMFLLENLVLLVFGSRVKVLDFIEVKKGIEIFGAFVTPLQIVIVISSLVLLFLLWLFIKYSKFGKIIRALGDNPELASINGIKQRTVEGLTFFVGSFLAGFAAILIALEQHVEYSMGFDLMVKSFTGSIIGGADSLIGSILGSYLLGLAENLGIYFLPSGYKDAIAFVLLILFLLFRPRGILGLKKGVRE